jgi:hypothetical protein
VLGDVLTLVRHLAAVQPTGALPQYAGKRFTERPKGAQAMSLSLYRRVAMLCAAAICVVFSLAFAIMVVAARADHNPFDQLVLIAVGSALLGVGLVVVLVQAFALVAAGPLTRPSAREE